MVLPLRSRLRQIGGLAPLQCFGQRTYALNAGGRLEDETPHLQKPRPNALREGGESRRHLRRDRRRRFIRSRSSEALNAGHRRTPLLHRLQFVDHALDHRKADCPKTRILRIEAERREQLGIGLRSAGREHREIALGEAVA